MLNTMVRGKKNIHKTCIEGILFCALFCLDFILGGVPVLILLWKMWVASSIKGEFVKYKIAKPSEHIYFIWNLLIY